MAKVIFRQKAIDDLNGIWEYTYEKWSPEKADKYYTAIKLACHLIGESPNVGNAYEGISRKLLGFKTGKHIIFYKSLSEDKIEIIRILHERMDLKNRITEK